MPNTMMLCRVQVGGIFYRKCIDCALLCGCEWENYWVLLIPDIRDTMLYHVQDVLRAQLSYR